MDTDIKKRLNQARPNLSNVSPLVYKITWAFVPVNLLLGFSILIQKTVAQPPLITSVVPNIVWGACFILLGLAMAYALLGNNWKMLKRSMTFALFIKAVWGIALAVQTVRTEGEALGVLTVWLFIAYVQANCIIHFLPPTGVVSNVNR